MRSLSLFDSSFLHSVIINPSPTYRPLNPELFIPLSFPYGLFFFLSPKYRTISIYDILVVNSSPPLIHFYAVLSCSRILSLRLLYAVSLPPSLSRPDLSVVHIVSPPFLLCCLSHPHSPDRGKSATIPLYQSRLFRRSHTSPSCHSLTRSSSISPSVSPPRLSVSHSSGLFVSPGFTPLLHGILFFGEM